MKMNAKVRNAALVGALAAIAATAWAASEAIPYVASPGPDSVAVEKQAAPETTIKDTVASEPRSIDETLSPRESVVTAPAVPAPVPAPPPTVAEQSLTQPGIVIEERRLTEDERIQAVVMDRIATLDNVSGKVGVESRDSVVTLTGYTSTAGQAWRVERTARGVQGVKYVQNQIRPRIGGSV
jgi:hypothetical protein